MSTRRLRYEAGGDPTQGPVDELAAVPPLPTELNDFPDDPNRTDTKDDDRERDQDQPDLDRFAERLGLRTADEPADATSANHPSANETSDTASTEPRVMRWVLVTRARDVVARSVGSTGAGFTRVGTVLDRVALRIRPR